YDTPGRMESREQDGPTEDTPASGVSLATKEVLDTIGETAPTAPSVGDETLDEILREVAHAPRRRPPPEPGERWGPGGRYVVAAPRGGGGMGVVYRAFDAEMEREVALKTLPALSSSDIVSLKEEFRALAGVTHPNLIELYELFVDDGQSWPQAGPEPAAFF